jgi:hypothetical protein
MNGNISVMLKKFAVPAIFFILGFVMIISGLISGQNSIWFVASFMALFAGVLSIAYSGGFLKTQLSKIIGIVAGLAALLTLILSWKSVSETAEHNKKYAFSLELTKQNLSDVRSAQKSYKEKYGVYASSWEKLEDFILNGTVADVLVKGIVPARKLTPEENVYIYKSNRPIDNNMSEEEAYILSKSDGKFTEFVDFKRDTTQVSFYERQFGNKSYLERREKANFGKLYVDSLKFIPFTGGKEMFELKAIDSLLIGSEKVSVVEVKGKLPFAEIHGSKKRQTISFGSLTLPDLSGSWE